MSEIRVHGLHKHYGSHHAVNGVDFCVKEGSFTVLLGPSGCGKSTTLRMIAGLETPTKGQVFIGDKNVTNNPPSKRGISMVFQSYALFPHLSVGENIIFGLKVRGIKHKERQERLQKTAKLVGLDELLNRKPSELSGGQKQRVALARAVIAEQSVCLMDEPLSNLDAKLRHEMRIEIRALQQRLGMSVLYVTHDQVEAMSMADQIILLNNGEIEQRGVPTDFYESPATTFVGRFIGTPPMNIIPIRLNQNRLFLYETPLFHSNSNRIPKDAAIAGIRPEDIQPCQSNCGLEGKVLFSDYHGSDTVLGILPKGENDSKKTLLSRIQGRCEFRNGDSVWVTWRDENVTIFDAKGKRQD